MYLRGLNYSLMKLASALTLLLILTYVTYWSQSEEKIRESLSTSPIISVQRANEQFGTEVKYVYKWDITADHRAYEKDLSDFFKTKYALKSRSISGIHTATGVIVQEWSSDSLSIFWKVDNPGEKTTLILAVEPTKPGDSTAVNGVEASINQQIKDFYHRYYAEIIETMSKEAMVQQKDVTKAQSAISRVEKNLESGTNAVTKQRAAIDKVEAIRRGLEDKKELRQRDLEKKEVEKAELEQKEQMIAAELSGKQVEYNELNRQGNLDTKEAQRAMKDLEKIKSRQTKSKSEITKKSSSIYKSKEGISKISNSIQMVEDKKKDHQRMESDRILKLDTLKSDIDKAKKKLEDETLEMNQANIRLDRIKSGYAAYSANPN